MEKNAVCCNISLPSLLYVILTALLLTVFDTSSAPIKPYLIPIEKPEPYEFTPGFYPPQGFSPAPKLIFTDFRITQGLDWDVAGPKPIYYQKIAGKDTLARFQIHTDRGTIQVKEAACHIIRGAGREYVGWVPGELGGSGTIDDAYYAPDPAKTVNCWIPGHLLSQEHTYLVLAVINDSNGQAWTSELSGYIIFRRNVDYFGWFIYPGYALPETYQSNTPQSSISGALLANLTGPTLHTMQRLWPIRAGVEMTRTDGTNPHNAGLRFYISPGGYTCGNAERMSGDPVRTCDENQRAAANSALALFNLIVQVSNANVDAMHWGTVVVPFNNFVGGQSCHGNQKVSGIGISVNDLNGAVMAHEPAHCLGLVGGIGPHADPGDGAHSITDDIPLYLNNPMVNFLTQTDEDVFQSLMGPTIYRDNDRNMMEGHEWNRLHGILKEWHDNESMANPSDYADSSVTYEKRFFLSGQIDKADHWETTTSKIIDIPVTLPRITQKGPYAVVVLDDDGNEMASQPFDISFEVVDGKSDSFLPLNFTVPYPPGASRVRVVRGKKILVEMIQDKKRPRVEIDKLSIKDKIVHMEWHGEHANGASLKYLLYFSSDDGKTRVPIATALTNTSYSWNTDLAEGTENARLILVATDGFNTAVAKSYRFSIPPKPPVVAITPPKTLILSTGRLTEQSNVHRVAPANVKQLPSKPRRLVAGQNILLLGSGFDLNDGILNGEALRWASDKQGALGIGRRLNVQLRPGTHVLTLQGVSSTGQVSSDYITVEVMNDEDSDGIPDSVELDALCFQSHQDASASSDHDKDGLTDLVEFRLGTNPCSADTDGDTIDDGEEYLGASNPLDSIDKPLPKLAGVPKLISLTGCGKHSTPKAERIDIKSDEFYASSSEPWLKVTDSTTGHIMIEIDCEFTKALPTTGEVMIKAHEFQPQKVMVRLSGR